MSKSGIPRHDPVPIGEIANPPFVHLPKPGEMFAERAARFGSLAENHPLAAYLRFLSGISAAQHFVQEDLTPPKLPSPDKIGQAREHAMPPLDRNQFDAGPEFEDLFGRLLARVQPLEKPAAAGEALDRVMKADRQAREALIRNVLADSIPVEELADHLYAAAALQVHFARLASRLDGKQLVPVGDGVCPACGAPPVSSMVVGWLGAHNARFCVCSLCATAWHYVRIKCTVCASTEGISYQEIEGGPGTVKAETCDKCHSYVKILQQEKDSLLDPVADDVATLGLDLLVRETGYRRAAFNPFLLGY